MARIELFPGMIGHISIPAPDFLFKKEATVDEALRKELAEIAEDEAHELEARADSAYIGNPELAAFLEEAAALDRQIAVENLRTS